MHTNSNDKGLSCKGARFYLLLSIHSLFIAKVERKKFFSKKVFEANREREDGEKKIRTEEAAGGENDHFQDTNLKVFFQFWVIYVGWMMGISRQIGLQIDTELYCILYS